MQPAITVVIPTFQRPDALERTLRALARQQCAQPYEIVVCDDGSPPEAAERIARAVDQVAALAGGATALCSIRLIRQANAGPAAARNAGARAAAADLLVFLDDDCEPAPDLLEVHHTAHAGFGDGGAAPVATMGHVAWSPALRVTPFMEVVVRGAQFNYAAIADPERVPFTHFYTANCALRRDSLEATGWFDASLPPFMEDTEFAYRFTRAGGRIVYRPQAVVYHEHHVELAPYLERQRQAGRAAVRVVERHPELFDLIGVGDVADVTLREQFYTALLRYAFVVGVEEGLSDQVRRQAITGAELQSQFERWLAGWAIHRSSHTSAWRARAEALRREVAARDAQIARIVQDKDAKIAALEAHLARINALPPVRFLHALRRIAAAIRRK